MAALAEFARDVARRCGGAHAYVMAASSEQELISALNISEIPVASLGGVPVCVNPIRVLARAAHARGEQLVCNNSLATLALCAPCAQGADISFEELAAADGRPVGLFVVVVGEGVELKPTLRAAPHTSQLEQAQTLLDLLESTMRAASDCAQVVSSYLAAHPRVQDVMYPGLKRDVSFAIAATTLHNGFGPLIDWRSFDDAAWQRIDTRGQSAESLIDQLEHQL